MSGSIFYLVALAAGSAVAFQVVINTRLGSHVGGPMQATFCSLLVGTIVALLYCFTAGYTSPTVAQVRQAPPWAWLGGFVGVFFLWSSVVVSARLGVALTLGLTIVGQMATSVLIDHFGLLGAAVRVVTTGRLIGVALMAAGVTCLIVYRE